MKPFRFRGWGSNILPLGPSPSRQCCPLSRRIAADYNSSSSTRFHASPFTSTAAEAEAETVAPIKRKRGRPPKSSSSTTSSSSSSSSSSPPPSSLQQVRVPILEGTASSLGHDRNYPLSVVQPLRTTLIRKETEIKVIRPRPSPPSSHEGSVLDEDKPISPLPLPLEQLPSPPVSAAASSAKLAALHARLSLPSKVPIETLARTLVDKTADQDTRFNNNALRIIGNDLFGVYITEHMLCRYPRLPTVVLAAATRAYVGEAALAAVAREWGIEAAAVPGGEVDPGLLQFTRTDVADPTSTVKRLPDSPFGQAPVKTKPMVPFASLDRASANFVRALLGAIYLHCGSETAHQYFNSHVLSRKLSVSSLFTFKRPERDLSRLCERQGFEAPVARLLSESGRLSHAPVYVVGIFSGRDKLGEGHGVSLAEARIRACIRALKGWYLYSPVANITNPADIVVPSMVHDQKVQGRTWEPALIDDGEVVV